MSHKKIIEEILTKRGIKTASERQNFLQPRYNKLADPHLLPDINTACERIKKAIATKQKIVVYGDYDIDGLSATALLLDAITQMGGDISAFIPSRFDEGYGLNKSALTTLHNKGAELIITVDCGSLSVEEVAHASTLGLDIIITDHHTIGETLPTAVAVINPKRSDHTYPFKDFAGVGVAFQLVRALQLHGLPLEDGQEKWLLDLVALGTVCDIVSLTHENRTLAKWGIEVMKQTRRPGLRALMVVSGIEPDQLTAKSLGFGLGPRLNASGRLETAERSLELLTCTDNQTALEIAQDLQAMNIDRRKQQNLIFEAATKQAESFQKDDVLVVSHSDWSHGIIGIVASKLVEKYHKPTFVIQEIGDEAKGSARSFGDFSVGEAVQAQKKYITKGGGHHMAAGITLATRNIAVFRKKINEYYNNLHLTDQTKFFQPTADITLDNFALISEELVNNLAQLEPYGNDNPQPIFYIPNLTIIEKRCMGDKKQHVKLTLADSQNTSLQALAFSAPDHFFIEPNTSVSIWLTLDINEWRGHRTVEGKLINLCVA